MKKALIALAVLGLTGGAAVAQSSVTLFGVIDADLKYVKTGDTNVKKLDSGGLSNSRFGVKGTEDLGGGLKASFWLESGFNTDTGSTADANRFWNRRVTVGLSGDFGEVRLGRNKTVTRLHIEDFDPYSATGLGDSPRCSTTRWALARALSPAPTIWSPMRPPPAWAASTARPTWLPVKALAPTS